MEITKIEPMLGLFTDPRLTNCLFVFESCIVVLERIAEWTIVIIHRPNLLAHVHEKEKRALPASSDWNNYDSRHLLGKRTAS